MYVFYFYRATIPSINQIKTNVDFGDAEDDFDEEEEEEIGDDTVFTKHTYKPDSILELDENFEEEGNNTLIIKNEDKNKMGIKQSEYYNDFGDSNKNCLNVNMTAFEPITIKTDFTYSVDNQKSPRYYYFIEI